MKVYPVVLRKHHTTVEITTVVGVFSTLDRAVEELDRLAVECAKTYEVQRKSASLLTFRSCALPLMVPGSYCIEPSLTLDGHDHCKA